MSGVLARIEGRVSRAPTFRSSRAAGRAADGGRGGRLPEKTRKRICCLRVRLRRRQGCDARLVFAEWEICRRRGRLARSPEKSTRPRGRRSSLQGPCAATGARGSARRGRFARKWKRFQGARNHRRLHWRRRGSRDAVVLRDGGRLATEPRHENSRRPRQVLDASGSSFACYRNGSESGRCDPATGPPSDPLSGRRRSRRASFPGYFSS